MNERLTFSWGHIIAFVALIIVSYVSFMGFTYLFNGNFTIGILGMTGTDLCYILFFIGGQQMKASGTKIWRKIVWERIFIFGTPLIFLAGMIAMSHFWTVYSRNDRIVASFNEAVSNSKKLFEDYDRYSENRINNYEINLQDIIDNRDKDTATFRASGFNPLLYDIQRQNMVTTLRLQLRSENYDKLRDEAREWINKSTEDGNTVWNVFLLGNLHEIKDAISSWENQLKEFSTNKMSNEELLEDVDVFSSEGAQKAREGIEAMSSDITVQGPPTIWAILFGVLMYLLLLFPYLIQQRHGRQVAEGYSLLRFGNRNKRFFTDYHKEGTTLQDSSSQSSDNNQSRFKAVHIDDRK